MKLFALASSLSLLTDILYFRSIEVKECVLPSRFQQPLALEISDSLSFQFFTVHMLKMARSLLFQQVAFQCAVQGFVVVLQ